MSWKQTIAVLFMSMAIPTSNWADAGIVVPNALVNVEGNAASVSPFSGFGVPSLRYQQVYAASQFGAMDSEGEFIQAISFRIDTDQGPFFGSFVLLRDAQVNCSTTLRAPDNLSTNFAENVGADDTVVYGRGELQVDGTYSVGARPQPFGARIILQKPFFYRPSMGNLLFDLRIFTYSNSFGSISLDYADVAGDSISSVSSTNVFNNSGQTATTGLVTFFNSVSIPKIEVVPMDQNVLYRWFDQPKGFVLETRTDLATGSSWQMVSTPSVYNDGYREVVLPLNPDIPSSFYRLKYNPVP